MILDAVEKPMLEVVMKHADGNQSKAAEWLGINRNTLRRKLLDHGQPDPSNASLPIARPPSSRRRRPCVPRRRRS